MKNILKINLIMILLNVVLFAQQNQTTSCYVEAEASNSYEEIQNAIATSTAYTELVIIARDFGATSTIPTWFTNIINDAPTYFSKATFGKLDYNIQVLQNGSNAFNFAYDDTVLWSGRCNHVHSERNVM